MPREDLQVGFLTVSLPSASTRECSIMHDLAGAFGLELNSEALEKFEEAWRASGSRRRIDCDQEADYVFVEGGRDAILEAAVVIHRLAGQDLSEEQIKEARSRLKAHKRPKPTEWKIGDVFAVPLGDGTCSFGQVLWNRADFNAPTCALFEHRAASTAAALEEILTSRTLAILHVQSDSLDEGRWTVIGHADPINDPFSGPCGDPRKAGGTHWDGLETVARAWWGLDPWNVYYKPTYLDFYLLAGVERSQHALLLEQSELDARRAAQGR
jgi:Immunity protein 26